MMGTRMAPMDESARIDEKHGKAKGERRKRKMRKWKLGKLKAELIRIRAICILVVLVFKSLLNDR